MSSATKSVFVLITLLAAGVLLERDASAQVLYGSIVGTVMDQSNAVIPNASVALTNKRTGLSREIVADDSGRYSIVNVLPGVYDLKVTAKGFRTYAQVDLSISPDTVARADVRLEV